jgi:RNA polymerase sigma factor (sigma-70 family)
MTADEATALIERNAPAIKRIAHRYSSMALRRTGILDADDLYADGLSRVYGDLSKVRDAVNPGAYIIKIAVSGMMRSIKHHSKMAEHVYDMMIRIKKGEADQKEIARHEYFVNRQCAALTPITDNPTPEDLFSDKDLYEKRIAAINSSLHNLLSTEQRTIQYILDGNDYQTAGESLGCKRATIHGYRWSAISNLRKCDAIMDLAN